MGKKIRHCAVNTHTVEATGNPSSRRPVDGPPVGSGHRNADWEEKGISFTIFPKQAALPCERPREETKRKRDENPAPCLVPSNPGNFILHQKPVWGLSGTKRRRRKREMHPRAVKKKIPATKIKRENFAPHSTIAAREGLGIKKKKKRKEKSGDRDETKHTEPRSENPAEKDEQKPKQQHR